MLIRKLQIILYLFLPDHLFDLGLGFDVEGVLVQQPHLLHAFALAVLVFPDHLHPHLAEAVAVVNGFGEGGTLLAYLGHGGRVAEDAETGRLDLVLAGSHLSPLRLS